MAASHLNEIFSLNQDIQMPLLPLFINNTFLASPAEITYVGGPTNF